MYAENIERTFHATDDQPGVKKWDGGAPGTKNAGVYTAVDDIPGIIW
jgi:hypothetical protein